MYHHDGIRQLILKGENQAVYNEINFECNPTAKDRAESKSNGTSNPVDGMGR
jgi:hypothetical protein